MASLRLLATLTLSASIITAQPASAKTGGHMTTSNFEAISRVIAEAVRTYGPNRVLLALDIDNTTLETPRDIGSEHWFLWQSKLIQEPLTNKEAVTGNIKDLLTIQSFIISQSKMVPVEPRIPEDLIHFGELGVKMMALTSRGLPMRDATEREIYRNGFPYIRFSPGPLGGYPSTFKPYDLKNLSYSGLSEADVTKFQLEEPEAVSYQNGIFLTAGQHKGIMLRNILAKTKETYDAIIFIDDRLRHSEGMQAAFVEHPAIVTTIQYTRTAPKIEKFNTGDKFHARSDWCEFAKGLTAIQGDSPIAPFSPCSP